jgi:hypothetical protein
MRKEDRVAAARQQQGRQEGEKPQPAPREQEKMRGATSSGQPQKPQRQGGKLPLPD